MVPAHRSRTAWVPAAAFPVNRMDALFDRVFGEDAGLAAPTRPAAPLAMWEDDDHVWIEAEVPGVAEADVDITVHKETLTIRVERKPEEGRRYLFNNRSYGRSERVIALPEAVHAEGVQATLKDGVLRVELPKSPASKPRKIGVKAS